MYGNKAVIVIALLFLLTACPGPDFKAEKKSLPMPEGVSFSEERKDKKEETIKNLICFKCHIYERFIQGPQKGVFSHTVHAQFEYHCNQCHSFRGHKTMVVNRDICINCHGEMPKLKRAPG